MVAGYQFDYVWFTFSYFSIAFCSFFVTMKHHFSRASLQIHGQVPSQLMASMGGCEGFKLLRWNPACFQLLDLFACLVLGNHDETWWNSDIGASRIQVVFWDPVFLVIVCMHFTALWFARSFLYQCALDYWVFFPDVHVCVCVSCVCLFLRPPFEDNTRSGCQERDCVFEAWKLFVVSKLISLGLLMEICRKPLLVKTRLCMAILYRINQSCSLLLYVAIACYCPNFWVTDYHSICAGYVQRVYYCINAGTWQQQWILLRWMKCKGAPQTVFASAMSCAERCFRTSSPLICSPYLSADYCTLRSFLLKLAGNWLNPMIRDDNTLHVGVTFNKNKHDHTRVCLRVCAGTRKGLGQTGLMPGCTYDLCEHAHWDDRCYKDNCTSPLIYLHVHLQSMLMWNLAGERRFNARNTPKHACHFT